MPTIPLMYESLKSVLPYMDPNQRFQISLRMPSITSLEKRLPLKIENLTFSNVDLKVNKYTYHLGVYRDYGEKEVPFNVLNTNNCGGSAVDFDQYGFMIYPGLNNVLPGDVDLRKVVLYELWRMDTPERELEIIQEVRILKILLAERLNQEYNEEDDVNVPRNEILETAIRGNWGAVPINQLKLRFQAKQRELIPFDNRRNNRRPPYTLCFLLTITSTTGRQFHRIPYNVYLYEITKALHTKLFGNRGSTISVKNLKIDSESQILRFPVETKLKVENLEVKYWDANQFEKFKNIVDSSSFPIQQLKIACWMTTAHFQHKIVKEAKSLIISNNIGDNLLWTPILKNLVNRKVFLENENKRNPPNNYLDLIEDWLENRRPVGTCFTMAIKRQDTVKLCLHALKRKHGVIGSSEKQIQIQMDATLILNVSYEQIDQPEGLSGEDQSKWLLRLKVIRGRSD